MKLKKQLYICNIFENLYTFWSINIFCYMIQNNECIRSLDLEDNDIGPEGTKALFQMLQENKYIIDVVCHY